MVCSVLRVGVVGGFLCQVCVCLFWVVAGFVGRERDVGHCACVQGVLRGWRSRCCLGGWVCGQIKRCLSVCIWARSVERLAVSVLSKW